MQGCKIQTLAEQIFICSVMQNVIMCYLICHSCMNFNGCCGSFSVYRKWMMTSDNISGELCAIFNSLDFICDGRRQKHLFFCLQSVTSVWESLEPACECWANEITHCSPCLIQRGDRERWVHTMVTVSVVLKSGYVPVSHRWSTGLLTSIYLTQRMLFCHL